MRLNDKYDMFIYVKTICILVIYINIDLYSRII